jgi:predicted nucleic acid-binding Zn ribbon protein
LAEQLDVRTRVKMKTFGNCLYCGAPLNHKGKYCTNACMGKYVSESYYNETINAWKLGKLQKCLKANKTVINPIKKYLLKKFNYRCGKCGWGEINPITGKSPLEVHHIDGDFTNNNEDNLMVICPNCHSLTANYKALNKGRGRKISQNVPNKCSICGAIITRDAKYCVKCYRELQQQYKPTKEELLNDFKDFISFSSLGKKYNVSCNAIRKWCKGYQLPYRSREIKKLL